MLTRLASYVTAAVLACVIVAGCGPRPDATVEGTVTIDGQLAGRGTVVFHPVEVGPVAYGNIFPDGTFSLRVGQGDLDELDGGHVFSGDYIVTVVVNMPSAATETIGEGGPPKPGARLTARKYANRATSDLRVAVKPGRNVVPLELEGAAREEAEMTPSDEAESEGAEQPSEEAKNAASLEDQGGPSSDGSTSEAESRESSP